MMIAPKQTNNDTNLNIRKIVGQGYDEFWKFKGRYRVCKGGRGSKKSCTTCLFYIASIMYYYHRYGLKPNLLVIRRYFNTHLNSTFAQLKWAIKQLKVEHLWKVSKSPLQLTYIPSGQVILFRGLDEPDSITSITVEEGHLCWVWIEEAFQCANEEAFNKLDMSIRGQMPKPLYKQITLTFNPWSENIWIKPRFFDVKDDPNIMAITRNYDCNEFLGDDDRAIFEEMKVKNPRRFRIEGMGEWGIAQGLVYNNWEQQEFNWQELVQKKDKYGNLLYKEYYGLDFGYSNDPTAFIACLVNQREKTIHIFDELYMYQATNKQIHDSIDYKGYKRCLVTGDSEDPRTINELKILGLRMEGAVKGPNSINHGIQKIQDFKIIVHPKCTNTIVELSNYVWDVDQKTGKTLNKPIGDFNHLMDALRYALHRVNNPGFSW